METPESFRKVLVAVGGVKGAARNAPLTLQSGAEVADKRVDDAKNDGRNHETAGQ
jgi:hypothetical protein